MKKMFIHILVYTSLLTVICMGPLVGILQAAPKIIALDIASDSKGDAASAENIVANAAFIDTTGLDGVVVNSEAGWNAMLPGKTLNYSTIFNELNPIQSALHQAKTNFIISYIQNVDPFDDWSKIINNFVILARASKDAGLTGIVFDDEPYNGDPWLYPKVKYASTKTLSQYQEQWRQRGKDLMNAVSAVWPEVHFLMLNGPYQSDSRTPDSVTLDQIGASNKNLAGFFFVGMLEVVPTSAKVIDGGEVYQYRTSAEFQNSYQYRKFTMPTLTPNALIPSALKPLWGNKLDISFGVFDETWIPEYPMSLSIFQSTLTQALRQADTYVWLYAEKHNYLKSGALDVSWHNAIKDAKSAAMPMVPTPPSSLKATAESSSQINLSWTDHSNNETEFRILRRTGTTGNYVYVKSVGANGTTLSDTGLASGTTYYYKVRAKNDAGTSNASNVASATTLLEEKAPQAPSGLSAIAVSSTQIDLSWTDHSDNETEFRILRRVGNTGSFTYIKTVGANVTSFSDEGLNPNTQYDYKVRAKNEVGGSSYSNAASAKTMPSTVVNIVVTDDQTSEFWHGVAYWTVTREGDTSNDLTVKYAIGGTATNGVDYRANTPSQILTGTVVIPAGSTTALIKIWAYSDTVSDPDETVTITLSSDSAYSIGGSDRGTVTINESVF